MKPISYHLRIWVKIVENTLKKKVILVISVTAILMRMGKSETINNIK